MKGNRFPGKEEERSSFRTAPCGLLEPWSQNRRTTGAMASHMASHRGFAGKNCVPTFRSRSCCNVWTPQDTLKRPRGAVLTRILLKRLRRSKNLVGSWTFATNENKKAHWAMERKVASAIFTGPPSGVRPSSTACSAHANNGCSTKKRICVSLLMLRLVATMERVEIVGDDLVPSASQQ